MNLKDLKTLADVSRWLAHHVEWSSEASSDMATRAVTIIDDHIADEGRCPFANYSTRRTAPRCTLPRGHDGEHQVGN